MSGVPASAGLLDNLIGINLSSMVARCGLLHRLCKMKIILSVVMHLKVANRSCKKVGQRKFVETILGTE